MGAKTSSAITETEGAAEATRAADAHAVKLASAAAAAAVGSPWLDNFGLAARLGYTTNYVNTLQSRGLLPRSYGQLRARRWRVEDVDAWVEAGGVAAARGRLHGAQATA